MNLTRGSRGQQCGYLPLASGAVPLIRHEGLVAHVPSVTHGKRLRHIGVHQPIRQRCPASGARVPSRNPSSLRCSRNKVGNCVNADACPFAVPNHVRSLDRITRAKESGSQIPLSLDVIAVDNVWRDTSSKKDLGRRMYRLCCLVGLEYRMQRLLHMTGSTPEAVAR